MTKKCKHKVACHITDLGQYTLHGGCLGQVFWPNMLEYGGHWPRWTGDCLVQVNYSENTMVVIGSDHLGQVAV